MTLEALRSQLQEALTRLAAPAEEQIAHLRRMEVWPSVDELALELDDLMKLLPEALNRGEVSHEEEALIRQVGEVLGTMSGEEKAALWDANQLAVAEEWEQVRRLANQAREGLGGVPSERPRDSASPE